MCGIAGYMVKGGSAAPAPALEDYATALSHRGPDGTGHYQSDGVGLVQTRLAIIDLKTGDQPLYGSKNTVLVANGEIYNYLELRRDFPLASFTTQSDCELPLFCHARDGTDFAKALRGMYGIALFDPAENALFLSRDPFGIKPLYYATIAGGLAFASEPQALLAAGLVRREICIEKANELLQLQFTTGRSTIFKGIERVLPGETLRVQAGEITERCRHGALPDGPPQDISESEALERLDTALMDSVAVHQRADVPYGMFLSGGVDSSALLACMTRLNDKPVRAFTAGFPGTAARDEREHAKRVAKAAGAEHVEISVTEKDFWSHLPAIAAAMDDPVADYAIVPIYLLAREAAKDLKVVLCGEGGDELFAGYGRYRSALRPWFLGGRAMRRRGFLDGLGVLRDSSRRWRDAIAASERTAEAGDWSRLQRAQAVDCADWLPNDLLIKLDRCLMAHGLEGRTPFLDCVLADFAFGLPDGLKIRRGLGKYLLRQWLQKALPEADPFSPKRGFTVPVGAWMAPKARALGPLVASSQGIEQVCNTRAVERLFDEFADRQGKREGMACWQLLFYALWHRIHGEGRTVQGDVFAMLEAQ